MRKYVFLLLICSAISAMADTIYHCNDDQGHPVYQAHPCEGETVKTIDEDNPNAQFSQAVLKTLKQMTGKTDLSDPKIRQAAEALAKTDAAKSYAFTQIYGISARHCGSEVQSQLQTYQTQAANIIALGRYYYQHGIKAQVGDKKLNESAEKLTAGLVEMTEKLDQEHQAATPEQLKRKCNEASEALISLSLLYGGE